jgi:tetrathionate reductase subunit B
MMFGDLNDPESSIAKSLTVNAVQVIKAELGTRPQTFYIGLDQEVVETVETEETDEY